MADLMCPFCQSKHPVGNGACDGGDCADPMDMAEDATDPMDKGSVTQPCSEVEHHPDCGKLSVPDTMVYCQRCGGETSWCGCRYRCKTCSSEVEQ